MYRSVSSTITLECENAHLLDGFWISFAQKNKVVLRKIKGEVEVTENIINVYLSQEETALFEPKEYIYLQMRYIFQGVDGATNIVKLSYSDVVEEGVINLENSVVKPEQ